MSSAYQVKVMPVEEFADNICAKGETHATIILSPTLDILVRV